MSKYIQIDVRLIPMYGTGGFAKQFPRLAAFLKEWGRGRLLENPPSLYHLVEQLERIGNDPAVAKDSKRALLRLLPKLESVRDQARENLLALRLKELDQDLYRLEDLFCDLEQEFSW